MTHIKIIEGQNNEYANRVEVDLAQFNIDQGHPANGALFTIYAMDGEEYLGGATFGMKWDYINVDYLYVQDKGAGTGRALMQAIEDFARENNKVGIYLTTSEYQAPDFYKKLGFIETGRIPKYVDGMDEILMVKKLQEK